MKLCGLDFRLKFKKKKEFERFLKIKFSEAFVENLLYGKCKFSEGKCSFIQSQVIFVRKSKPVQNK